MCIHCISFLALLNILPEDISVKSTLPNRFTYSLMSGSGRVGVFQPPPPSPLQRRRWLYGFDFTLNLRPSYFTTMQVSRHRLPLKNRSLTSLRGKRSYKIPTRPNTHAGIPPCAFSSPLADRLPRRLQSYLLFDWAKCAIPDVIATSCWCQNSIAYSVIMFSFKKSSTREVRKVNLCFGTMLVAKNFVILVIFSCVFPKYSKSVKPEDCIMGKTYWNTFITGHGSCVKCPKDWRDCKHETISDQPHCVRSCRGKSHLSLLWIVHWSFLRYSICVCEEFYSVL